MLNLLFALRLFISFIFFGLSVFIFLSLQCFLTVVLIPLITIAQGKGHENIGFIIFICSSLGIMGLLSIIITFLLYLLILRGYSRLLKGMWSSPPKIFASPTSFRNNTYHFFIALLANIPAVIIFNIFLFFLSDFSLDRYISTLAYEPLYEVNGHNSSIMQVLTDKLLSTDKLSQATSIYGIMFFITSYFLYYVSDKYKKNKKQS
jgi:hypothetical protein